MKRSQVLVLSTLIAVLLFLPTVLTAQEPTVPLCNDGQFQGPYFPDPSPTVPTPWGNGSHEQGITCQTPGGGSCSDNWGLDFLDQEYDHSATNPPRQPDGKYSFSLSSVDNVRVYIVDSGIKSQHSELRGPDLRSRVQPGVNITRRPLEAGRSATEDCYPNSHGTHVSAIAAGNTYGVAKRALLIPVRLTFSCGSANRGGEPGVEDFVHAIDWIIQNHPSGAPGIVSYSSNPSLAPDTNPKYVEAVRRLAQRGLLLVQSAGNDEDDAGPNTFSGSGHPLEGVILVGGLDPRNQRWRRLGANDDDRLCQGSIGDCGSNFGPAVDLWAPAQHIVSASNLASSGNLQGICRLSGTSMAAPHVTGVAARLWARYPNASASAIKAALLDVALSGVMLRCGELPPAEQGTCLQSTTRRLYSVFPASGAPVAGDDRFYTEPGQAIGIFKNSLKAGDLDWDNQSLQIVSFGIPQNGTLEDLGLSLKYTPANGFEGTDSFTYTIQDGSGNTAIGTVWIVVEDLDEPPVAWTDCYTTAPNQPVEIYRDDTDSSEGFPDGVLRNDWDPEGGELASQAELLVNPDPQQGSLMEGPLGDRWIFTPAQNFQGTAVFKYYVVEQRLYRIAEGTVLVKVGPEAGSCPPELPNNPVASPDSLTTTVNTPLTFLDSELRENDTPGAVFVTAGQPQHGTLTIAGIAPEGVLYRYEPPAGFTGPDSFIYTIHGYRGVQSSAVATINVLGSSNIVANPDYLFTTAGTRVRFLSTDLTANDTGGVVFIRAENPQHGTLEIAGIGPEAVVYDFVPEPGFAGTASVEYLISPNGFEPYTRGYVTIYVTDNPPAAAVTAGCTGLSCMFNAAGSTDDLGISSYAWTFGDGTTGSGVTASHTYAALGNYQATVTVTDTASQTSTASQVVSPDALPVASFTFTCSGLTCSFNGSATTDDGGITAYAWSFGDGTTGSGVTASHIYATSGERTATLTVTDTVNQTATTSRQVRIDLPPTPCFTASRNGLTYTFDASCSTDEFGISTYSWNFGDSTIGSGKIVSHTYGASGPRTVVLTVTDTGSQTATTSQTVNPDAKPVANFTWSCTQRTCTFNGTSSTDNQPIVSYAWSFGDGTTGSGATVTHTYATSGNFSVTLTVTDTVGQTATTTKTVTIDLNPTACFTAVRDGLTYAFDASCTSDDLGISTYSWNFGDGTTGSGKNVSRTYATSGPRTVVLTVTDTGSHTATASQTVNPDAKPVANFTWSCTLRTCSFNGTSSTDNQPIASYSWNFGDGTTGSGATVSCTYASGGPKTVTLTVTDSVGQTNSKVLTIAVNRPPVANADSAITNQDVAIDINVVVNDSDPDGDPISVSTWSQPAHGSVAKNANGTMRYTPAAGYAGGDSFTYQLTDGKEPSASATVSLTVVVPNKVPDARDDGWSTYQNGPTNVPYSHLLANDYDPNGDALTVTGINTAGLTGTLDCSSGTWCRYTPPSWFVGTTSFTYSASDGKGGTDPATIRIKVGVANQPPVPQDDILETAYGASLIFTRATLLVNDSDPDGDVLSVTWVYRAPLTAFGTVSCAAANYVCTYTPPAGFTGVDVLYYRASDGITFTDARIRILVRPPSPAVLDAREDETFFTTTGGTFLSYTWMTSNDYDPEGGALTVVSVDTAGLLGTLDCTTYASGCQYTRGTSDVTRFRYTVRDPQNNLATTTVTLKPGNWSFNLMPVIANDQLSTRMNTPLSFSIFDVLRNDYDPDNDQLDVIFYFYSQYGRVSCTTPAYFCTYTPNANFTGTDTLTYVANDRNNSANGSVTMTVQPMIAKDAQVLSQSVPVSMFAGQSYPVSMRIKNVGTTTWGLVGPQCNAFRLGSVNPYDNTTWGSSRAEVPATVAPGGEVTLTFNVTAPTTPGTYNFQRRMVHECVEWFGDLSPNAVVTVSP